LSIKINFWNLWSRYRPMFVLNTVVIMVMMGMGMVVPILPLYGRSFGVSTTLIGFLITSFGLARVITDLPAGIWLEKYGRRIILIGGPFILKHRRTVNI